MTMNHGLAFRCISMPISSMVGVEDKSNYYCIVGTKRSDASDIPDQAVAWERYNLMNFQRSSHLCKLWHMQLPLSTSPQTIRTLKHALTEEDRPSCCQSQRLSMYADRP